MPARKTPIKYTSREFDSIKNDLIEHAKRYYPDTFKDFNEASFGALMLDTVAYIGDILSFYLDYQVNESYMDSAIEYDNVIRLARQMGYKFKANPSSFGTVAIYVIVPASASGLGPDTAYLPMLKKGTQLSSTSGNTFMLDEEVRFDDPSNEIVAARTDSSTGLPTHYAIRSYGRIVSGIFDVESIGIGGFERFKRIKLDSNNISEIVSVVDSEGNEYLEVEHLSQNTVYKEIINKDDNKDTVPSLMRPFIVPRRFVVEREQNNIFLQFGYGGPAEIRSPSVAEPKNVVLQLNGRDYITDKSFDPYKLLNTDKFGIAPANTTLTITYRANTAANVNAAAGSVTKVVTPLVEFADRASLLDSKINDILSSFESFNEEAIVGDTRLPTAEEIKRRTIDFFATQNRAVTQLDYEALVYSMPERFGSVKRCKIIRDPDSLRRNLNLYLISEDSRGKLVSTNTTIKENVKTWLGRNKMISDTIDILDAKVVNIGVEFEVIVDEESNKFQVLAECNRAVRDVLAVTPYIGEPLYITDMYSALNKVKGVVDAKRVEVKRKLGSRYSTVRFNIDEATSADGRYISVPKNVIMEIKFPDTDIKGAVS
tara:strand:- start:4556 stop:6349 length:1794 start_codon:yes stop_codon:yes gene_type:complete